MIHIVGIEPIAPHTLIFSHNRYYAILVTGVIVEVQDLILPAKQAEKRSRIPEYWAGQAALRCATDHQPVR
jgi:hypothetical protein